MTQTSPSFWIFQAGVEDIFCRLCYRPRRLAEQQQPRRRARGLQGLDQRIARFGVLPAQSKGDYILKVDAHCAFDNSFDEKMLSLIRNYEVAVARRWTLNLDTWKPEPRAVDYYYLSCPWAYPRGSMMSQSCPWITKTEEEWDSGSPVDNLMCFQGSMWMISREHWNWLGGLEIGKEVYAEHHEISMKTWLGVKRVVIVKDTWYAHPRQRVGGYRMDMEQVYRDHHHSALYWTTNQWEGRVHDYAWLIDKFWPLPTASRHHSIEKYIWPEDWK